MSCTLAAWRSGSMMMIVWRLTLGACSLRLVPVTVLHGPVFMERQKALAVFPMFSSHTSLRNNRLVLGCR